MAILVLGFAQPPRIAKPVVDVVPAAAVGADDPGGGSPTLPDTGPSLQALRRVASMELRQPLFPPPPAPPTRTQVATPSRPLSVELIGTIDEPDRALALLLDRDRSVKLMFVGETADTQGGPVTIKAIAPRRVVIEHGGATRELAMPPEEGPLP